MKRLGDEEIANFSNLKRGNTTIIREKLEKKNGITQLKKCAHNISRQKQ